MRLESQVRISLKAWCSRALCWIVLFWFRRFYESNTSAVNCTIHEMVHRFTINCEQEHIGNCEVLTKCCWEFNVLKWCNIIIKRYGATTWILSSMITGRGSVVIVVNRIRVEWSEFRIPKGEAVYLFSGNLCIGFKDQIFLYPMAPGGCFPGNKAAF